MSHYTDEINITGKPSNPGPFGTQANRADANWLNADFNARRSFQQRQSLAAQKAQEAAQKAAERNTASNYRNDYALASRMNADVNARNRASARAADTSYRNDYALASRMNADVNARNRASARAVDAGYRNDYALASRMNADKDAAYKRTPMYFREQEFGRLGRRGAQATNNGELKELIRIDRHLAKMDKTLDKYTKANIHNAPEREAALIRARQTLANAYSQVSAGAEGAPGLKGFLMRAVVQRRAARARDAAGGGYGGGGGGKRGGLGGMKGAAMGLLGDGLELGVSLIDPVTAAIGIGVAGYEVPAGISDVYSAAYNSAKPYINLRRNAGNLGLASGLNSRRLTNSIFSSKIPSWEKRLGLGPQEAMSILQGYGIAPTSTSQAIGDIKYIAGLGHKTAFAGMGLNSYEDIARTQSVYGMDSPGKRANTQALKKLFTEATAAGLDRASVLRTTNALLRQTASAGGFTNSNSAAMRLQRGAYASGLMGGRDGSLALTANAQANVAYGNLGNNPITTMPIVSFIEHHGGMAKNATALQMQLDAFVPGSYQAAEKTAAGRRYIKALLDPGNMANYANALGNIEKGHPRALARNAWAYSGQFHTAYGARIRIAPNMAGMTSPAFMASDTPLPSKTFNMAVSYAAGKTGVDPAYLYGIGYNESRYGKNNYNPATGASGPLQNLPGSAGRPFHYLTSKQNLQHPRQSILESARIFKYDWNKFNRFHLSAQQHYADTIALYGGFAYNHEALSDIVKGEAKPGWNTYASKAWAIAKLHEGAGGKNAATNKANSYYQTLPQSVTGTLSMLRAEQQSKAVVKVLSDFSTSAVSMSSSVESFSASVAKFATSVNAMKGFSKAAGAPTSGGYTPMLPQP